LSVYSVNNAKDVTQGHTLRLKEFRLRGKIIAKRKYGVQSFKTKRRSRKTTMKMAGKVRGMGWCTRKEAKKDAQKAKTKTKAARHHCLCR